MRNRARRVSILSMALPVAQCWSGQGGSAVDGQDRSGGGRPDEAVQVGVRYVAGLADPPGGDGRGGVAVQLFAAGLPH